MAHDGKFAQYIRRKHIHWMVAAVLCALVALLVLRRIQMPANVPLPQVPVSDPQPKTPYSIPIENTKLYVYVSGKRALDSEESTTYPEEAAVELAKSFLDDLMTPSDARSTGISKYAYCQRLIWTETARTYTYLDNLKSAKILGLWN